jgi:hypothetical protein
MDVSVCEWNGGFRKVEEEACKINDGFRRIDEPYRKMEE